VISMVGRSEGSSPNVMICCCCGFKNILQQLMRLFRCEGEVLLDLSKLAPPLRFCNIATLPCGLDVSSYVLYINALMFCKLVPSPFVLFDQRLSLCFLYIKLYLRVVCDFLIYIFMNYNMILNWIVLTSILMHRST